METVGFSAGDWIDQNAALRLTLGETFSFSPDSFFASSEQTFYQSLIGKADLIPFTYNDVTPGGGSAVFSVLNKSARIGSDILAILATMSDNFCEVKTVQLLTDAEKSVEDGPDGAAARADVLTQAKAAAASNDMWSKIADKLGVALHTLEIIAIIAVVVLVVIYLPKPKK